MDIDGLVERRGQFIVFETKNIGVPVPAGQLITLRRLHGLMIIQGKREPALAQIWCAQGFMRGHTMRSFAKADAAYARRFVELWYEFANAGAA